MSIKTVSMASVLGTGGGINNPDQSKNTGNKPLNFNRFHILRDRSHSAGSFPPLSPAAKRPAEGDFVPDGKNPRLDNNAVFRAMEDVEKKLAKGKESVGLLKNKLADYKGLEPGLNDFLGGFVDSLESIMSIIESVSSNAVDQAAVLGNNPNRGRSRAGSARPTPGGTVNGKLQVVQQTRIATPAPSEADIKKRKFVNAVKEAEKSVLIFKLDLGPVPIMNTGTISRKVTENIVAKAAVVEGKTNGRPSEDKVIMLEDALSMVKGMEFFGKVTKPYTNSRNPADPDSGKFCTLPVKMSFKDKESKNRAEAVLRANCKLQCSTPYPLRLRQVIKATIEQQKLAHKEDFIQVRVDPENMLLRISRKTGGKIGGRWLNNVDQVILNEDILDLGSVTNSNNNMEVEVEEVDIAL